MLILAVAICTIYMGFCQLSMSYIFWKWISAHPNVNLLKAHMQITFSIISVYHCHIMHGVSVNVYKNIEYLHSHIVYH